MKAVSAESLRPFSDVADTALLTLFCHAAESRRAEPLLHDPWAERIVEQLQPLLAAPGASRLRRVQVLDLHLVARRVADGRTLVAAARPLLPRLADEDA